MNRAPLQEHPALPRPEELLVEVIPERGVLLLALYPFAGRAVPPKLSASFPPHLNISPAALFAQLTEQHLLAAIQGIPGRQGPRHHAQGGHDPVARLARGNHPQRGRLHVPRVRLDPPADLLT